jgi:hypothetical protein
MAALEKSGDSERSMALFSEMTELGVSANVIVDDAESVLWGVTKVDLHDLVVPVGKCRCDFRLVLYNISFLIGFLSFPIGSL